MKLDGVIAMDENTIKLHKKELKRGGFIILPKEFENLGINLNVALSGALIKILGIEEEVLIKEIKRTLNFPASIEAAKSGYKSAKKKFSLAKQKNKLVIMNGNEAISEGAINSDIDLYIGYPMTPSTGLLHALAGKQAKYGHMVFQPESELSVINSALGASFTGAKVMIGSSGGGYDLMGEALSLQGTSEIPLVVHLASRMGPGTGVPTYTSQADLDIALRTGHGEFPRIVIAPGDPKEAMEKINEAFYLSEKYGALTILLTDKHLVESQYSFNPKINRPIKIKVKRKVPGKIIVKVSSYEQDKFGNTTEDAEIVKKNVEKRMEKYDLIKKNCKKFEMIKIHGEKDSKNLIVGWGSTKGVILDAIEGLDFKFLQVIYMKPMSNKIKKEIQKAKKVILIENNVTGQLGRLIREKTGLKIDNRLLKYDGRPYRCDELRKILRGKTHGR